MENKINYFNFLRSPYFTEKSKFLYKKNNVLVFKVYKNINKLDIYYSVKKIFNLKIKKIRTLIVKGKKKIKKNVVTYSKSWKKVYIIFNKKQNLNLNNLFK